MFLSTVWSNGLGIVDNDLKGLQMASRQWKITTQQTWEKSLQYVIFGKVYKQKKVCFVNDTKFTWINRANSMLQ